MRMVYTRVVVVRHEAARLEVRFTRPKQRARDARAVEGVHDERAACGIRLRGSGVEGDAGSRITIG